MRTYNYNLPGAYFITLCTQNRHCLFGTVTDGVMTLNEHGSIVAAQWQSLTDHYTNCRLDDFVVMPNHFHAVVWIANFRVSQSNTSDDNPIVSPGKKAGLPELIRAFKSFSARAINSRAGQPGHAIWQRSFHDRVIRNEGELQEIRTYIRQNPAHWDSDELYHNE